MARRIAVLTDAISASFFFPVWHRYYGALFGTENLFVVTYSGALEQFANFPLGGIIQVPTPFVEKVRTTTVMRLCTTLLATYDTVIHVDPDEILVVDPRVTADLAEYVDAVEEPYVTARGFDVIQLPEEDPFPARTDGKLLQLRSHAYANTALNKTCIVRTQIKWGDCFNWASVTPKFGPLFLLHLKNADVDWQIAQRQAMVDCIAANPKVDEASRKYIVPDREKLQQYLGKFSLRRRVTGVKSWYRDEVNEAFLAKINLTPSGFYIGSHTHENVLCELPPAWRKLV